MGEYGGERKAEGEDVVFCEKIGSQSMLVKCIVFEILNDEQGAEGKLGRILRSPICFVSGGDAARYGSNRGIKRERGVGDEGWTGGWVCGDG